MRSSTLLVVIFACGPSAAYQSAQQTLRTAAGALTEVESAGAEQEPVAQAVQDAHNWLRPTEAAVDVWAEGGHAAYERVAPCLAASLAAVAEALVQVGSEVPRSLEQAEDQARGASELGCSR